MALTVNVHESPEIRVTNQRIDPDPPSQVDFTVKGTLSVTEALLDEFKGSSLRPTQVTLSAEGSQSVEIDLVGNTSLWLDAVDVGVETPNSDDLRSGLESARHSSENGIELSDSRPGSIAFTVEGAIQDVSGKTLDSVIHESLELESVQFAVDDRVRPDGGPDTVLEAHLLGYGVTIYRNGNIEIGSA